jgi:hypothetical protein
LVNKRDEPVSFRIEPADPNDGLVYRIATPTPTVAGLATQPVSVLATWERSRDGAPATPPARVRVRITSDHDDESRVAEVSFVAPR